MTFLCVHVFFFPLKFEGFSLCLTESLTLTFLGYHCVQLLYVWNAKTLKQNIFLDRHSHPFLSSQYNFDKVLGLLLFLQSYVIIMRSLWGTQWKCTALHLTEFLKLHTYMHAHYSRTRAQTCIVTFPIRSCYAPSPLCLNMWRGHFIRTLDKHPELDAGFPSRFHLLLVPKESNNVMMSFNKPSELLKEGWQSLPVASNWLKKL